MIQLDTDAQSGLTNQHLQAALIVRAIYGKDPVTEAELKLAACMSFIRFFANDPCFHKSKFYDACMRGTLAGK